MFSRARVVSLFSTQRLVVRSLANPRYLTINHRFQRTERGTHFSPLVLKRNYAIGQQHTVEIGNLGDSVSEGRVLEWVVPVDGFVKAHHPVVTLETEKTTQPVNSPVSGKVVKHLAEIGNDLRVGTPVFVVEEAEIPETKTEAKPAPTKTETKSTPATTPTPTPAKPATPTPTPTPTPTTSATPVTPTPSSRTETRVKMSKMRIRIAERLKDAQNTAAMLTTFNEIDMENIINLRTKYKEVFEKKHGVKLGFMSAFAKASSAALHEFPSVNAVIDGTDIIYRDYHDISVAVATPTGLVVPVIRDVQSMSFADIEKTIAEFGNKARQGSLSIEEMQGGTFTISNGGVYGSLMGTPILNPPQSAILGMHGTNKKPVVVGNEIKIRPVMIVALTYDHRIIDGREAVLFLKKIKSVIEDPQLLLLDL